MAHCPFVWLLSRQPNVFILNLADSLLEHIREPIGFFHLLGVETIYGLVNVPFKVQLGDEMISAENDALKMPPKAFNTIGGK